MYWESTTVFTAKCLCVLKLDSKGDFLNVQESFPLTNSWLTLIFCVGHVFPLDKQKTTKLWSDTKGHWALPLWFWKNINIVCWKGHTRSSFMSIFGSYHKLCNLGYVLMTSDKTQSLSWEGKKKERKKILLLIFNLGAEVEIPVKMVGNEKPLREYFVQIPVEKVQFGKINTNADDLGFVVLFLSFLFYMKYWAVPQSCLRSECSFVSKEKENENEEKWELPFDLVLIAHINAQKYSKFALLCLCELKA